MGDSYDIDSLFRRYTRYLSKKTRPNAVREDVATCLKELGSD